MKHLSHGLYFQCVYVRFFFLKDLDEQLSKHDLTVRIPNVADILLTEEVERSTDHEWLDLDGPSWVDDHCIFTEARDPGQIAQRPLTSYRQAWIRCQHQCWQDGVRHHVCGIKVQSRRDALDWRDHYAIIHCHDALQLTVVHLYKHFGTGVHPTLWQAAVWREVLQPTRFRVP